MKEQVKEVLKDLIGQPKPKPPKPIEPNYWTYPKPNLWLLHRADGMIIGHSTTKPNDHWKVVEFVK